MNQNEYGGRGKKSNQKLKPYLVLQYLLKHSDENHAVSAEKIRGYLQETCGIDAERRSIYRDIEEINKAHLMLKYDTDIYGAEIMLEEDEDDVEKLIAYNTHRKGFYVKNRKYDAIDIRLLAECVYSAKFLSPRKAQDFVDIVCEWVSEQEAELIRHDAFLTDRVKTDNEAILNTIGIINDAMRKEIEGEKHTPEQISFQYLTHKLENITASAPRRKGDNYIVSPYKLLINDGNYYLLSFDSKKKQMRTYRVDRMRGVHRIGIPREGAEEFAKINLKNYTKRVFSMYGGKKERVKIRFINPLLDAVIDRFGNDRSTVSYERADDRHFVVTTEVEISEQFYGWLCGFGNKAKIIYPQEVAEKFKEFVDKISAIYNKNDNPK